LLVLLDEFLLGADSEGWEGGLEVVGITADHILIRQDIVKLIKICYLVVVKKVLGFCQKVVELWLSFRMVFKEVLRFC